MRGIYETASEDRISILPWWMWKTLLSFDVRHNGSKVLSKWLSQVSADAKALRFGGNLEVTADLFWSVLGSIANVLPALAKDRIEGCW